MEAARREAERAASYYQKLGISELFVFSEHPAAHEFDIPDVFNFFDKHLN